MTNNKMQFALVLWGCLQVGSAAATEVLWLSEIPPAKSKAAEAQPAEHQHDHQSHVLPAQSAPAAAAPAKKHDHDSVIDPEGEPKGKDHAGGKQIWLRQGVSIKAAPYVATAKANESLTMIDFDGKRSALSAESDSSRLTVKADLPSVGFYDLYMEQRAIEGDSLVVQLPKVEVLWATCVAKDVDEEAVAKPIINSESPLEIIREHLPDEGCFTRLVSGDVVSFQVLSLGKPVADVPVTMVMQDGWSNTLHSGADGRVKFTLIRSYFPKWLEFKKYHVDNFLAYAEVEKEEAGAWEGKRYSKTKYVASLPGKYRPSPHDYRSYAWGLGITLFVVVFGWLAIYLYRRRRLKPYKEERLDDKA
ncbi:MAG: hypothetical protein HOO97_11895 [Sideroxydans sp.]|nr:hypothetical protein [Sideroxydans sp.]